MLCFLTEYGFMSLESEYFRTYPRPARCRILRCLGIRSRDRFHNFLHSEIQAPPQNPRLLDLEYANYIE